jgi:hypothetical protein
MSSNVSVRPDAARAVLLSRLLWPGAAATQAIYAACRLRIADMLGDGAMACDDLALAAGAHASSMGRLLRALTSINVFAEPVQGIFKNNDLSNMLRADHPQSARTVVMAQGAPWVWQALGGLHDAVISGEPAFESQRGEPFYSYMSRHQDEADVLRR